MQKKNGTREQRPIGLAFITSTIIGTSLLISCLVTLAVANYFSSRQAIREAEQKAMILLDRNLTTHNYFGSMLKPEVFKLSDQIMGDDYFNPVWMSSTYAIRQIDKEFRKLNPTNYYYKECAINARHPDNEADEYESAFLLDMNVMPDLNSKSEIREIDGEPYFVVIRRGEILQESCMRCHSSPDNAPAELVARYGDLRSFNRQVGETVSAVSIRIPIAEAYKSSHELMLYMSGIFAVILAVIFAILYFVNKHLLFEPLERIREKAVEISHDPHRIGEQIDLGNGRELNELTTAFNRMSFNLRQEQNIIEAKTVELKHALDNVKQLEGMLPICISCKRIREDSGYWKQIELYLHKHSEATFDHSLCPDCAKNMHPDFRDVLGDGNSKKPGKN